ncbi:MAG: nucleotide exchange factor GrpE [Candidatus Levybacteria bacterium]|nr:nucleotide exchange factor GrpE [Candidatus Levybacteria bacterium]
MNKDDKKTKKTEEKVEEKGDQELEELKKRNEELENQVKRVLADYQNLEKRVQEEKGNWIRIANKELLLRLLPVLDTLMLAGKHVKDQGLQLSIQQFLNALKNEGVEKVETVGKDFDPNAMECVEAEEGEEGKVIDEIRAGYKLNDMTIRPAQVRVGKS